MILIKMKDFIINKVKEMNEIKKLRIFTIVVIIVFTGGTYLMSKGEKVHTHDYFHRYYLKC